MSFGALVTQLEPCATIETRDAATLFAGPGELRARCRALDWRATPLGPIDAWAPALCALAPLVLAHPFPTILFWGAELVQIYNDAFRDIVGDRHAMALGESAPVSWPETWHVHAPIIDRVRRGESVALEDAVIPILQFGAFRDASYNVSYSPAYDEAGAIAGILLTVFDTTRRVRAEAANRATEARQTFLARLVDALHPLTEASAIHGEATRLLREQLDAGWCCYIEWDEVARVGVVLRDSCRDGLPSFTGVHDVRDARAYVDALRMGGILGIDDFASCKLLSHRMRERYGALGLRSMIVMSLVNRGRLVGSLLVGDTEVRAWSDADATLLEAAAERTWAEAERVRAEGTLRETRAGFLAVADLVPDLLWQNDTDGATPWYNARWLEYTGQSLKQARRRGWMSVIHPEDRERSVADHLRAAISGETHARETRIRRSDGTYRWFLVRSEPLRNARGKVIRWFGTATDIHAQWTARDEIERSVAERTRERDALRRQLASAEEGERRRLARELHDRLGQHLTGLSLGIDDVRRMVSDSGIGGNEREALRIGMRLRALQELTSTLTSDVRTLAVELRPPELDDVGLGSALETYVTRWSRRTRIAADVEVSGIDATAVLPDVGTAIYRIVQEALNNVVRHAGAGRVGIIVERTAGGLRLIVEDDGCGFDADGAIEQARSESRLGLAGMRERTMLIGGTFIVESAPGSGTTIFVTVPDPPSTAERLT